MHPLQSLYRFLNSFSCPQMVAAEFGTSTFLSAVNAAIEDSANIRSVLLNEVLTQKAKRQMKLTVRTYQAVCIDLSNQVYYTANTLKKIHCNKKTKQFLKVKLVQIQHNLLAFLCFIQDHFCRYFDYSQRVPVLIAITSIVSLGESIRGMKQNLEDLNNPELLPILIHPAEDFMRYEIQESTYRQLLCMKQYVGSLKHWPHKAGDQTHGLLEIFIKINFIPDKFLRYYLCKLKNHLHDECLISERKEECHKLLVQVRRLSTNKKGPGINFPSVKEMAEATLLQEIENSKAGPNEPQAQGLAQIVQTPMSVSQLALFVRVMVDTGTIKCHNHALMLRMLAAGIKTDKAGTISPESLRSKYYTSDPASINILKDYIIRIMNHLRHY